MTTKKARWIRCAALAAMLSSCGPADAPDPKAPPQGLVLVCNLPDGGVLVATPETWHELYGSFVCPALP
jgi:hypothetical protein